MEMKMNKKRILAHLREAKTELDQMIGTIEKKTDFDFDGHYAEMQHIYHHLNTAWNS